MNKFTQSQNNLIDILFDLTEGMNEANDYTQVEEDVALVDKLSTIIKRMGDTVVFNIIEEGETE